MIQIMKFSINKTKCKLALMYMALAILGTARVLHRYGGRDILNRNSHGH